MQFLLDNYFLIAAAVVSGALLAWPMLRSRAGGPALSTLQATQLINARNAQVVDVREAGEYGAASLPNARNIPLGEIDKRAAELRKERPVIVFCNGGGRAPRAAARLRAAGLAEVYVLEGGLAAWREAGLPLKS
ncbi:MAG TPA: rhodanese-like domain-containing protein [Burkholderiaceae bacterium]|nr:rhodanese-like domain-containing protein [Burkholderiaceae bacterium]